MFDVVNASLFGALGALISIILRSEKIPMDPAAGVFIHYMESVARVAVGMGGALLMALAVKANIVLGFHRSLEHPFAFLVAVCITAGSSERIVTGLIKRVESSLWAGAVRKHS